MACESKIGRNLIYDTENDRFWDSANDDPLQWPVVVPQACDVIRISVSRIACKAMNSLPKGLTIPWSETAWRHVELHVIEGN